MSNRENLANGFIASATVSAVATSFDLQAGQGAGMPATPFKLTVAPFGQLPTKTNSEIMLVTGISTDTLTVTRAQDGTTAQTFVQGDIVSNSITLADVIGQAVTVATAATTAAKVGTTTDGNYTPAIGDVINVTFSSGCDVNTPTLDIDGSGAKNIRLGNVNVGTTLVSTTSALTLQMWCDGTYWQIYGSLKNDNTTYSEIQSAEITAGTASTARAISGRRSQEIVDKARTGVVLDTRTVNGHALSSDVTVTKGDVGLGNVTNDAQVSLAGNQTITGDKTVSGTWDFSSGEAVGISNILLDYNETANLWNGGSISANSWTDIKGNQSFTVANASSMVIVLVNGAALVGINKAALISRIVIDSGGTPIYKKFGGNTVPGAGSSYINPLGAGVFYITGLSAGTHTVKVQMLSEISNNVYLRALDKEWEYLSIQVIETA